MKSAWVACAAVGLLACAHRFGRPAEAALGVEAPADVRWETGGPHALTLAIRNTGSRPLELAAAPGDVRVSVFALAGSAPLCESSSEPEPTAGAAVRVAPGERRYVTVPLPGCELAAGEYRYEASYDLEVAGSTAGSRTAGRERGRIAVRPSGNAVELPASRRSPPRGLEAPLALPQDSHLRPPVPSRRAASLGCVARELAARGLNAFGDPAGMVYPDGPPLSSDAERERAIIARYPEIGTRCRMGP